MLQPHLSWQQTVAHVQSANDMVRRVKTNPIKLVIHSIREEDLRNVLVADILELSLRIY